MPNQKLDFHEKVSSTLLRRLAEAADGHRGGNRWLVVSTDEEDLVGGKRGHYIMTHETDTKADGDLPGKPKRHRIGPFFTNSWVTARNRKIDSIVVHTSNEDGSDPKQETLKPEEMDSLFWSEAVIDKMLIPYYVGIYGLEYGQQIRDAYDEADVFALTHLPGSEYVAAVHKERTGETHPNFKMIIPQ